MQSPTRAAFWAAGDCYQLSWGSDSPASLGSPWVWVVFDLPLGLPLPGPVSGGGLSLNKDLLFSSPLLSGSFQDFPGLAWVSQPPLCPHPSGFSPCPPHQQPGMVPGEDRKYQGVGISHADRENV